MFDRSAENSDAFLKQMMAYSHRGLHILHFKRNRGSLAIKKEFKGLFKELAPNLDIFNKDYQSKFVRDKRDDDEGLVK